MTVPTVHLVGAGPGDPELLTRKAERLLREADVVLHDRLVAPGILALCGAGARVLYTGRRCGRHDVPQRSVESLMIHFARRGQRVVRLKGGDPFIFGRGGEELDALREARIPAEVVPGVTAALGCAAAAQIPLTHRDHAHSVLFLTGRDRNGEGPADWEDLTRRDRTLVVYMGLGALETFCTELTAHGLPEDWPVALIADGTTPDQHEIRGTLDSIGGRARAARLRSPVLALVGQVARTPEPDPGPDRGAEADAPAALAAPAD